jgi:diguanylate cyclase (GGDEF)-like protein
LQRFHFVAGIFIFAIVLAFLMPGAGRAAEVLSINSKTEITDLAPYRNSVTADHNKLTIQPTGDPQASNLESLGQAPVYFWSFYSIRNSSDGDLSFNVAVDHQGFPGSGILSVRSAGAQTYQAVLTNPARPLVIERNLGLDYFQVSIKSGQVVGVALQSASPDFSARLYPQDSITTSLSMSAFLRGVILGVAVIVLFGLILTYAYRPNRPVMAGLAFALMANLFILFEQGSYPSLPLSPLVMGAVLESLFAAALAFCVATFTAAHKRRALFYYFGLAVVGALIANTIFALIEPGKAASVARVSFALLTIAGFLLTLRWRKIETGIVDRGLVFWTLLLAWVLFGAVVAVPSNHGVWQSQILLGLMAVVLIGLALELMRHVLVQGLVAKPFITDQSRRSLALASAGHSMWEFSPAEGRLEISEDLPRQLGYSLEEWSENARHLFKSILDPADLKAYEVDVEHAALRQGAIVDRDLRLCDAEGRWRWFHLKARTIPNSAFAMGRCIGTLTETTGAKLAEARQSVDALADPVTGLPNRSLFMDRLERELGKIAGQKVKVLIVEIENFKTLNESLGQENGDRVLQIIGARIRSSLETDETVARLSGGQYGVMLFDIIGRRDAAAYATQISDELAETLTLPHYRLNIGANVGLSGASAKDSTADELLRQANVALLEAHHGRQGHVVSYDVSLKDERAAHLTLEADLRRAMRNDEIEVYFQPICDLATGIVAGYEALARWNHPKHGILLPQQFIDMAERIGVIGDLGDVVLAGAARQLGIWQRIARQGSSFFVSVNVSVTHLLEDRFLDRIETCVERENLEAGTLKIEITESVIMRQPERVFHIMSVLRDLGIGLACDDFGTGFSSLASLRDLPFDTLKLDRSFIASDILDERSSLIISAIADMAHDLGMVVVAEGIERQEQIDVLSELGCDLGQGYLIGVAQTAKAVSESLTFLPRYVAPKSPAPALPQPVDMEGLSRRLKQTVNPLPADTENTEPEKAVPIEVPEVLPSLFSLQKGAVTETSEPKPAVRKPPVRAKKRPNRNLPATS